MPAIGQGSGKSNAGERRARRRTPPPPRPAPRSAPRRLAPAFGPPSTQAQPFRAAQRQAAQRTARARRRLPQAPVPHIPIIRNPTPAQTRAARQIVTAEVRRRVGPGGSGVQRAQRQAAVVQSFGDSPQGRQFLQAARHYAVQQERQTAAAVARVYGVGGSRAQRIRAGRQLIAQRTAMDTVRAGRPPTRLGIGPATITPSAVWSAALARTSLAAASPVNSAFRKVASDVGALGSSPFIGGYELGAGTYEALRHGNTSRLQRLGTGIATGIAEEVRHPLRYAGQHPLLAALDFAAGLGAVGRVSGAVARGAGTTVEAGGVRGALARAGHTARSPLAMVNDAGQPILHERTFSKDVIRKVVQMDADSNRKKLRDAAGNVVHVQRGGRKVPVLLAHEGFSPAHPFGERAGLLKRRADFLAGRGNAHERMVRDQAAHEMSAKGVKGRRAQDLVAMVTEGTVSSAQHFEGDLLAERNRIVGELAQHGRAGGVYRHTDEIKAARNRVQMIDAALRDKRVLAQKHAIVQVGEDIGRRLNETERQAIALKLLHPARATRSRLIPAAIAHLDARHFTGKELRQAAGVTKKDLGSPLTMTREDKALLHGAVRHPDGRFLGNGEIEAALRAKGRDPATVAYLPHRLDVRGRRAYHTQLRLGNRGTLDSPLSRTGSAYRKGVTESSMAVVHDQAARIATRVAKAQELDRIVREHGMRHPAWAKSLAGHALTAKEAKIVARGGMFTESQAAELAQRLAADRKGEFVPVRAYPSKLGKEAKRVVREDLQGPQAMETLHQGLLNSRIVTEADPAARAHNVVLMPRELVDRLNDHLRPAGRVERAAQWLNRPFRLAVLPQPRWLAGNFTEPMFVRLPGVGSGINIPGLIVDVRAATRYARSLEAGTPEERLVGQQIRAHQLGGLLIGGGWRRTVRRSPEEFTGKAADAYTRVVAKLPVVGQMGQMVRMAGRGIVWPLEQIFHANRVMETFFQKAALGQTVRADAQRFTGSWIKSIRMTQPVLDELKAGSLQPATLERWMRAQHELLGQYDSFSPGMRAVVQSIAPFLPWALNAARFAWWTMPIHRTVQTALLVKTAQVVEKDWAQIHSQVPPGGLKMAIPTHDGGWIDLARYTPYGFSGPLVHDETNAVAQEFFPLAQGPLAAAGGKDPFGRDLSAPRTVANPRGRVQGWGRVGVGFNELAEAVVPYLATARRLREGGGTAYSTSTVVSPQVKPGTQRMSAVTRTLSPIRPTYLRGAVKPVPVSGPAHTRAVSDQDRIDAALDQAASAGAGASGSDQDRINRALDAIGMP